MSFKGINGLRAADEVINYEPWQLTEMIKCYEDPIYFIKNYVKINMKDRGVQLFDLYPFQEELIGTFLEERFTIAKFPRQCGKCVFHDTMVTIKNEENEELTLTIGELESILEE